MIEEVKATLAMEGLELTEREEALLRDYANGKITSEQLVELVLSSLKSREVA
ncbi:MAG: antitoxin VbhA family protein [Succinivibrionaceae bacterium]|nr:antitoxin VbhA family protein [Succinivibrionaceae bacterium]